jgi:hypothetical protein
VVLGWAGVAAAQESATLLLKSGERVSGSLVDMTGSDFIMTVNGQERRVPISDAAVIDFSGNAESLPAAEVEKAARGQNVLVLRDGQQMQGKLFDVGGTHPLRITFNTASGQSQDYNSNQVGRIYLAAPSAGVGTSGGGQAPSTSGGATTVHIPANRAWTPAGVTVQQGQMLTFSTSGRVQLSTDTNNASPVGGILEQRGGARASLPGAPNGALIGRIGNGRPFGIGDQTSIPAPGTGPLYLGVNDDNFADNSGEFVVTVTGGAATLRGIRRR